MIEHSVIQYSSLAPPQTNCHLSSLPLLPISLTQNYILNLKHTACLLSFLYSIFILFYCHLFMANIFINFLHRVTVNLRNAWRLYYCISMRAVDIHSLKRLFLSVCGWAKSRDCLFFTAWKCALWLKMCFPYFRLYLFVWSIFLTWQTLIIMNHYNTNSQTLIFFHQSIIFIFTLKCLIYWYF